MKTVVLKLILILVAVYAATLLNAQNTALGVVSGSLKDTVITYKENPEKHAHATETVIPNKNKPTGDANANTGSGNANTTSASSDALSPTTDPVTQTETTTVVTTDPSTDSDNTCSCTSLHIAYGVAAFSMLGFLIFLVLYLNEKNRDKNKA